MEKNRFFPLIGIMLILTIAGIALVPNEVIDEEVEITVSVDFCSKPITTIEEIDNGTIWAAYKDHVITPTLDSEMAGENGNVYAPDILIEDGVYKMWYGAQSSTGHDSIHFATSDYLSQL